VATALLTGPEHTFRLANAYYCQMVGRSDLIGKTYRDAFPELPEHPLRGILDRVYRTGQPFSTQEYSVPLARRGDGVVEDCYFRFNLEPLRDPAGEVYGMMAVAVDITEQVRARRVLERSQIEREKLLGELESSNRAKDEFLAMLGHELRNPLSPIATALQLMRMRGDGKTTREQQIIERQVNHLTRLVDDLLDVSKITRGKVELRKERVEIADVIGKAVEMASDLLEQRGHALAIDVPQEGLRVDGDPVRLAQVVANLLTNSARYTNPGGRIRLEARREGGDVVVRVKDNGIGISAELLPHVFDLFVQGKRRVERAQGGLGIGLTIVKNLVGLHGGSVVAHSEGLGRGSEFVITLPAVVEAGTRARDALVAGEAAAQAAPGGTRVLVVDDNTDAADLLAELLREAGHQVAVAYSPVTALEIVESFHPQVAILDLGLPVMDGYELAARLHKDSKAPECRLIALTGYGQSQDRERSSASGFAHHLVKPVDIAMLTELVTSSAPAGH
jgi:PAS domain S-box-containing protein